MAYDEMELDLLGDRRTALFVIISDTDDTFNFVVSIMYTQLFNLLCDRADDQCGGQLKYHVRLLLDEFANIGLIPKFDKLIATIRSREISASIILQSQSPAENHLQRCRRNHHRQLRHHAVPRWQGEFNAQRNFRNAGERNH